MWDLIVSVPDHCLSFYFIVSTIHYKTIICYFVTSVPEDVFPDEKE